MEKIDQYYYEIRGKLFNLEAQLSTLQEDQKKSTDMLYQIMDAIDEIKNQLSSMPNGNNDDVVKDEVVDLEALEDFDVLGTTLIHYTGDESKVVIPQGITEIGKEAFQYKDIYEIVIPGSCKTIGESAFNFCESLTKIKLNEGIERLEARAFCGCEKLKQISFPRSLVSIGNYCFCSCDSLSQVRSHDGLTYVGADAFACTAWINSQPNDFIYVGKILYKCKAKDIKKVIIPAGTLGIAGGAFENLHIEELTLPDSVNYIGAEAFRGHRLQRLHVPSNVKNIEDYAFACDPQSSFESKMLSEVTFENDESVENLGTGVFRDTLFCSDENLGTKYIGNILLYSNERIVNVREGTVKIAGEAFSRNLREINIPDSVVSIGSKAFEDCALEQLILPSNIQYIGESAFESSSLQRVVLPKSLKIIAPKLFSNCVHLRTVILQDNTMAIESEAFKRCGLADLYIPNNVNKIAEDAFENTDLKMIVANKGSFAEDFAIKHGIEVKYKLDLQTEDVSYAELWKPKTAKDFGINISIGHTIKFGRYHQDTSADNAPIEWIVLDIKNGAALLISKYALDSYPYNRNYHYVTWESCDLRSWLRYHFLSEVFSQEEQEIIISTAAVERKDRSFNDSGDNIFIIDKSQYEHYGSLVASCNPTKYAISKGHGISSSNCKWWLRSEESRTYARYASCIGGAYGSEDFRRYLAVRPALWINIGE